VSFARGSSGLLFSSPSSCLRASSETSHHHQASRLFAYPVDAPVSHQILEAISAPPAEHPYRRFQSRHRRWRALALYSA
jgi:hypothetical protein